MPDTVALHHEVSRPDDAHVVLMGGSLGATLAMWDAQAAALAERFRVVRFDHRGHGGSPVPPGPYAIADLGRDVLALLDALGVERASYCGLSIGGMAGMWLAANAPSASSASRCSARPRTTRPPRPGPSAPRRCRRRAARRSSPTRWSPAG